MAAGAALGVGLVARDSFGEIDAKTQAFAHDIGLAQELQRRVHADAGAFDTGLGRRR